VDPLGLVAKGSTWYLIANTPRGLRTFRVSRIGEARSLDKPSQRPAGFNLAEYWKSSTAEFLGSWQRYQAVLRVDPSAASEIKMWRIASPISGQEKPDASGWTILRLDFDSLEEALFVVLGFGPRVDVIEPVGLRERVVADVVAMHKRHRQAQPPG